MHFRFRVRILERYSAAAKVFTVAFSLVVSPTRRAQGSASAAADRPQPGHGHAPDDVAQAPGAQCAAHAEHDPHPDAARDGQHGSAHSEPQLSSLPCRPARPGGHDPAAHPPCPRLPRRHELQHQDLGGRGRAAWAQGHSGG